MSLYVEGPRHYRVTDVNQGAKVLATAYIMMLYPPMDFGVMANVDCTGAIRFCRLLLVAA